MCGGHLRCGAVLALAAGILTPLPSRGFDLADVTRIAERLAQEPYRDRQQVPEWMRAGSMTYDQWRDIRYRPDRALWRDEGSPFQIQFFHPGLYFDRSVQIHVVDADGAHPFPYSPSLFHFGKNTFGDAVPRDVGYAGFRVHYPLKTREYLDEVIVFLGASYFRAVGRDTLYGLSARGLAIDTVAPSGEEFPRFTEFWLEKPARDAASLVAYALLDGPSTAGAYRFVVTPGVQTRVDVEATLFARRVPTTFGVAPLTSMFFFGESRVRCVEDFRPEVHDSDGLLLHFASGEWLWRPLDNPPRISVSSFRMRDPRGFGLLQRDREFANHQDLETRAELRPSTWIEPRGDWGDGRVQLVEIPTANELMDNIVAFWVPDSPPRPGTPLTVAYTQWWYADDPARPPGGRAIATRRDRGAVNSAHDVYRYVIDFAGPALDAIGPDTPPRATVTATSDATVFDEHLTRNPLAGGWRLTFQIRPKDDRPVELRAYLARGDDVLTETWSSAWLGDAATPAATHEGGRRGAAPAKRGRRRDG